jgi:hypothetical protein
MALDKTQQVRLSYCNAVRDLVSSDSYQRTLGAYFENAEKGAYRKMMTVQHGSDEIWSLRAELAFYDRFKAMIESLLNEGDALRKLNNTRKVK